MDWRALTGIRFLAALHVLILHETQNQSVETWVGSLSMRTAAVSFFFLLSGFVLTLAYKDRIGEPVGRARFWVARIARLYPLYLVGLLLYMPIYWGRHHFRPQPGGPVVSETLDVFLMNVFAVQTWYPDASCVLNCPGWSVAATLFFAATLPLAILVIDGWGKKRLWSAAAVLLALSMATTALFVAQTGLEGSWINVFHKNPAVRLPEFLMGVLLAFLWRGGHLDWTWLHHKATFPAVGALAIAAFLALPAPWMPYIHNGLLAPLFALIIVTSPHAQIGVHWLKTPTMQRLGQASFAFYILHIPIANYLNGALWLLLGFPPRWTPAFVLLDILVVAWISLRVYERFELPAKGMIVSAWDRLHAPSLRHGAESPTT